MHITAQFHSSPKLVFLPQIAIVARMLFLACLIVLSASSFAQGNPADCNEVKDPDTQFQLELCKAHPGCKLVMGIHSSCVRVKKFLISLNEQIGEGVKTLFGRKKEVTNGMVFEASLNDTQRTVEDKPGWKESIDAAREGQKREGKDVLTGNNGANTWVYVGTVKDGKADGNGTRYFSNSQIQRGQFKDGEANGTVETIRLDGERKAGQYENSQLSGQGNYISQNGSQYQGQFVGGKFEGQGVYTASDGTRYEGGFKGNNYNGNGVVYRPDGTVKERGLYSQDQLDMGQRFNSKGEVIEDVNRPAALLAAAESRQKIEAERLQKEVAERHAAEREYRSSLGSMNPGQLFALADELNNKGEDAKGREVLRALLSRFPDHPLAAAAAQQLTKKSTNSDISNGAGVSGASDNNSRHSSTQNQPRESQQLVQRDRSGEDRESLTKNCAAENKLLLDRGTREAQRIMSTTQDARAGLLAMASQLKQILSLYQGRCKGATDSTANLAQAAKMMLDISIACAQGGAGSDCDQLRTDAQNATRVQQGGGSAINTGNSSASSSSMNAPSSTITGVDAAGQCLRITRPPNSWAELTNTCSFDVEASWCYLNLDCKYGTWGYTNQGTVRAGATRSASSQGSRSSQYEITFGACKGKNSALIQVDANTYQCR